MNWQIERAGTGFAGFSNEWDHLNRQLFDGHPLFDSRFVGALLDFFGNGTERLCIHRSNDTVDGALILCPRSFGRWALFLPAQAQVGAMLLRDAAILETLMAALPGYAWTIDLLAIDPGFSPDLTHMALPRTLSRHTLTMSVDASGTFDAYWQARPNQLRKNLRRYQRRCTEDLGAPRLTDVTNVDAIDDALDRYGEMESSGWKGKAGTAISRTNAQGAFYSALLRQFALAGKGRVAELRFADKLAASRLLVGNDRMWVILKTTYDESLAAFAPGRQLLYELLRRITDESSNTTVEFYTNATRDQAEWATDLRYICHHQVYRGEAVSAVRSIAKTLQGQIAARAQVPSEVPTNGFDPGGVVACKRIEELSDDARGLLDSASQQEIEFSPGWFCNLQDSVYSNDAGVRYYCAQFNGKTTAVVPLRLVPQLGGRITQIESLANFYTSHYAPTLSDDASPIDLARLIQSAEQEAGNAAIINLHPMDPASAAYGCLLAALRSTGWIPFRYFCFGNWYLPVDRSWSDYLASRSSTLRNTIKRKGKKFAAEGGSFEILLDAAAVEPAIREFDMLHRQRWKKAEPYLDFVPGLIRWLAAEGKLRLGFARVAGHPVAAQIWIVNHGKASIYKLAYDEDYAAYAPGTLLTAHLMQHVIDQDRVLEIDYLVGDEAYKKSWMSHRRERWGIVAYKPTRLIAIALLLREVLGRMLRLRDTRPPLN